MRKIIPVLYILLHLSSGQRSPPSRCGSNLDDFSKLMAGYESQEERCSQCEAAMAAYRCKGFDYMFEEFKKMCENYQSHHTPEQCLHSLEMYKEEVRYLLWDLKVTDPEACRFVLGCWAYNNSVHNWEFELPTDALPTNETAPMTPFSVMHLTDTHVSTQYTIGATYDCFGELCCSDRQLVNSTSDTAAGPFGDIRGESRCDLPMRTLKSLLANANRRKFSHVYLTGDFIPHTTFNYTFEKVIFEIKQQTNVISDGLAVDKIFPSIGNHDDYPLNLFPTHKMQAGNYSIDKLYNALWEIWGGRWIPEDQETNFKKGGYYTALAHPGLRIFSMNTVYCYYVNHWLAVNPRDPEDQLEWLKKGLEDAARKGEKAHLLGHVPPGTLECRHEWAKAYQKIVARFRNVITGQFFGHMHWDMFSVDFDPTTQHPTGVQLAGPSATTYLTGYPTYRIMHFNASADLLDMDTYLLNITKMNEPYMAKSFEVKSNTSATKALEKEIDSSHTSQPWQLAYSYKDMYGMKDLTPGSFEKLIDRMQTDNFILSRYYRAYFQHRHELREIKCHEGICDSIFYYKPGTRHAVVCEMYSTGTEQQKECLDKQMDTAHKGVASFTQGGLLLAIGGVILTVTLKSFVLNFD